jgi:hypothetical protein
MKKANNSIIFKFTRKLITCNTNQNDFSISMIDDELITIYLWGDSFIDNDISFIESNKGFKVIDFEKDFVLDEYALCKKPLKGLEKSKFESFPVEDYSNFVELKKDFFHFYWNITDSKIVIEVHVKTKGWVSFGFSITDGTMFNSDVFVGWITDEGVPHFSVNFLVKIFKIQSRLFNPYRSRVKNF